MVINYEEKQARYTFNSGAQHSKNKKEDTIFLCLDKIFILIWIENTRTGLFCAC